MPDLKELLGAAYTPEVETALAAMYVPKANAAGEAKRLREENSALGTQLEALKSASLTEQEKIKLEADKAMADAKKLQSDYSKALSKLKLSQGIADTGLAVDEDMLDMMSNFDPDSAGKMADNLKKLIMAAKAAGEATANQKHLSNNSAPGGNTSTDILSNAEKKLSEARTAGATAEIVKWTRVVNEERAKQKK